MSDFHFTEQQRAMHERADYRFKLFCLAAGVVGFLVLVVTI